jgi:hypothetical protein
MRTAVAFGVAFVLAGVVSHSVALAGVEGDPEVLRMVAKGNRANRQSIVTWKGEASLVFSSSKGASKKWWHTGEAEFVCDAESGSKRWNYKTLALRHLENGREWTSPPEFRNTMFRDDAYYKYARSEAQSGPMQLVIRTADDGRRFVRPFLQTFDPYYYFTGKEGDLTEVLLGYAEGVDNSNLEATISRDGDLVVLEQPGERRNSGWTTRYTFDLSKGCNLVHYLNTSPDGGYVDDHSYEFELVNGVWVPRKVVMLRVRHEHEGRMDVHHRAITFTSNTVNAPLDPSEFNIEMMGIRPGDSVVDYRTDEHRRYRWPQSEAAAPAPASEAEVPGENAPPADE